MSKINVYMGFKDNAREAMEFYKSIFGGELTLSTYKEGGMVDDPTKADLIMHAMLIIGPEMTLMGSDQGNDTAHDRMQISLSCGSNDAEKVKEQWAKLSEGANITMPLSKAPWGDSFGQLVDKFGIGWMVNIVGKKE